MSTKLTSQTLEELKAYSKSLRMAIKNKESQTILNIADSLTQFIASHHGDFGGKGSQVFNGVERDNFANEDMGHSLKAIGKASGIESDFEILKTKPIRQTILEIGIKLERDLQNVIRSEVGA